MADPQEQVISAETKTASNMSVHEGEDQLVDGGHNLAFKGATLQLENGNEPSVAFAGPGQGNTTGGISRARPGSAFGKKSTTSTSSVTSRSSRINQSHAQVKGFFCYREGAFEAAVEKCRELVRNDLDGEILGAWLLTEIDHWNHDKEKVVLLTDNSMMIVKYDFIALKALESKRLMLHMIDTVTAGDFYYPEKSVMDPRDYGGIRISWNQGQELSFGQRWNPWCSDIPYVTLTNHLLLYNEKEKETVTYSVDDFYESVVQQINQAYRSKNPGRSLQVKQEPLLIESYASLSSTIFNQSYLGYSRERGGISF